MKKLSELLDDEGQAYALEAAITVIFISSVVIFIAPSIANPTPVQTIQEEEKRGEVQKDLNQLVNAHQKNGQLKSLTTNFLTNAWRLDKPGNGEYEIQPVNDKYAQSYARIPGTSSGIDGYYLRPPGPVGANIEQIENEHDVWIAMYLIPAYNDGSGQVEEITFVESNVNDNIVAERSTDIVLFDNERFRTPPDAKSVSGSPQSAITGDGIELKEDPGDLSHNYYVNRSDNTDHTVFNTVEVKVIAYEDPAIGGDG